MSLACNQLLLWHISKLTEEYGMCIAYCISDESLDCETALHILYHNHRQNNHKDKSKHYIVTVICTFAFVNVKKEDGEKKPFSASPGLTATTLHRC